MGFTVAYSAVSWTAGDVITEAKLDAMVANDQAYDSHSAQGFELDEMTKPSNPAANKIRLYAKDKAGVSTLYYLQDNGTEIELGTIADGTRINVPKINEDVELDATSTELNKLHAPPTWTEVSSFSNSWVNSGGAWGNIAYLKDGFGFVHLKGSMKSGTIGASTAFTLPTGYRPAAEVVFAVSSNNAFGACEITSSGVVYPIVGSNVQFSLDGITFLAA